jgi:hypothetical protein
MPTRVRHHLLDLPSAHGSYALLSDLSGVETAVFFVHGFGGDPLGTWQHFQTLIDSVQDPFPWWKESDLYFFKYASVFDRIAVSANELATFIEKFFPEAQFRDIYRTRVKPTDAVVSPGTLGCRRYKNLVLVGHSEGAVLIRKVAIDFVRRYEQKNLNLPTALLASVGGTTSPEAGFSADSTPVDRGMLNASLCLFAPAIFGASPSDLPGFAAGMPFFRTIMGASAGYRDLSSAMFLHSLRDDTLHLADRYQEFRVLRARVWWGKKDSIVTPGEYRTDSPAKYVDQRDHVSICKPAWDYLEPLEWVR